MKEEVLVVIDGGYFYCGLVAIKGGLVIKSATIIKYMIGWNAQQVKDYCLKKNFKIVK